MRQNLTNVKEIDIKDVEHFYVVGSTTKDGLIEGKSNVKLDLKKAASEGGDPSSEDAERMYEALFGQTPYIAVSSPDQQVSAVPLYEIFAGTVQAGIGIRNFLYKSSTPVPKATMMEGYSGETYIVFPSQDMDIYMMEMPAEMTGMPDTWYVPIASDINLIGYTTPTGGNPTTVSGTLPNKSEIEVLVSAHPVPGGESPTEVYTWDDRENAFMYKVGGTSYYILKQSGDNVIVWSYEDRIS